MLQRPRRYARPSLLARILSCAARTIARALPVLRRQVLTDAQEDMAAAMAVEMALRQKPLSPEELKRWAARAPPCRMYLLQQHVHVGRDGSGANHCLPYIQTYIILAFPCLIHLLSHATSLHYPDFDFLAKNQFSGKRTYVTITSG